MGNENYILFAFAAACSAFFFLWSLPTRAVFQHFFCFSRAHRLEIGRKCKLRAIKAAEMPMFVFVFLLCVCLFSLVIFIFS